jgi:hypothetical protein
MKGEGHEFATSPMEAARAGQRASTKGKVPTSVSDKPFLSKVKSWLPLKKPEPAA